MTLSTEPPSHLTPEEVQVWAADLDAPPLPWTELEACLAPDERARRDRFHQPLHRRRHAAGRGLLRRLLADHLGRDPASLRFVYGEGGKPELAGMEGPAFNLSHSEHVLLIALTAGPTVGVDVEILRPLEDVEGMARMVLTPDELTAVRAAPPGDRSRVFLTFWTAKEAFLKATGMGLGVEPRQISLDGAPGAGLRLGSTGSRSEDPAAWSLCCFELEGRDGRAAALGAVAMRAPEMRLRLRSWSREGHAADGPE